MLRNYYWARDAMFVMANNLQQGAGGRGPTSTQVEGNMARPQARYQNSEAIGGAACRGGGVAQREVGGARGAGGGRPPAGGIPAGGMNSPLRPQGSASGTGHLREGNGTPRSKGRGVGKQRRLSFTGQDLVHENSQESQGGSEHSVSQEVGMATPGSKTTRDRKLAVAARGGSIDMLQYLIPLMCVAIRNSLWVITWQRVDGVQLLFGHQVTEMPTEESMQEVIRRLYLNQFPSRILDIPMARIIFGPVGNKLKLFVPIVDARLTENKLMELEAAGLRLVPLYVFAEARKQEQAKIGVMPTMITTDSLSDLKIRLPKERKLVSTYVRNALTQPWPQVGISAT
ncbi:hypothetical protein CBR_g34353 [Chara braunii]|uniref:Uncharacterized protein n=1 Tax=Chara braunii TaxID=69332 RepID=A0A388LIK6_CHABU|nr:hypothetical protein CBR_g34353 [Chara braunii]|eukprot:GBG82073.1 hypothetical protein CBR_g34353 [Chara braunii]